MIHLVRKFGDDNGGPVAGVLFDRHHAAHPDRTSAGGVGVVDSLVTDDQPRGGKVGAFDPLNHRCEGGLFVGLEILQAPVHGLGELAQVVRRHIGGHTHRDAAGSVGQKVWEPAWQDRRFLYAAVIVGDEIDCLLVDFAQHLHRQRGEPGLCVPHRSRRVVARRAEVALPVDQRIAQ